MGELEAALAAVAPAQSILPLAHTTTYRSLRAAAARLQLSPSRCRVFKDDRLYLYYGLPWYRLSDKPALDANEVPVALLFDGSELGLLSDCYPFDTGAMENIAALDAWKKRLFRPTDKCRLPPLMAPIVVRDFFGSAGSYIRGVPKNPASPSNIGNALAALYAAHIPDVDDRQRAIELHTRNALPIGKNLAWIGFPDIATTDVMNFLARIGATPKTDHYEYRVGCRPSGYCAILTELASRFLGATP